MRTSFLFPIIGMAVWCVSEANAQLLTNNGAAITITGGDVQVNGSLTNASTGLIGNDGTITLTGDLVHNAANNCFGTSQGAVVLAGGVQTIGGSSVAAFNDLTLAGTGAKTLQQDVQVGGAYAAPSGVLQLNDRPLVLNTFDLSVNNANTDAIQRTTGYIVSEQDPTAGYARVRWNIGEASVGTSYVIPFGNSVTDSYLPFTATITAAGTGASGWIAMATYSTNTAGSPNNRPLPAGLPSLIDVSGVENAPNVLDRWWVMESGGYTAVPMAAASFTYRDSEWSTGTNAIVEGALQLERQAGVWTMIPTVTNIGANTLAGSAQPLTASSWTAAELDAPLPVELIVFTGERLNERDVLLQWSTASERDNAGFEVWRKIEGEEAFTEVGWVNGAGTSQGLLNYELVDENAATSMSYYQLKQVDHDGQSTWSPVVAVAGASQRSAITLYPNPARDTFFVLGDRATWTGVSLLDASGRMVREWSPDAQFDLGGLPGGVYVVRVGLQDGTVQQERLVVE